MTSTWRWDGCGVRVVRLVTSPSGNLRRVPVPREVAEGCSASSESTPP